MKKLIFVLSLLFCFVNLNSQTITDTIFYSTTVSGGNYNGGVIFEWTPISNIFTKKIDFETTNGKTSYGSLTLYNGKFYGITYAGGQYNNGVIFEWEPITNTYIKKIDLDNSMGSKSYGSLILYNDKFYGMTYSGGSYSKGVIFEWDPSTNVFTKKIDFNGTNGATPQGSMVLNDGKFYGMTMTGGSNNTGVIFEWDPSTNVYIKKIDLNSTTGNSPFGQMLFNNGVFYGMTYSGGSYSKGVIFEWDPFTNIYTKKIDFNNDGRFPAGSLVYRNGVFYGMTYKGGNHNAGVIFEWNSTFNVYTKKIDFDSINGGGNTSSYSLVYGYGTFNAMTANCGIHNKGVIFTWNPDNNQYDKQFDFDTPNGMYPSAEFSIYTITSPTINSSNITFSNSGTNSINIKWSKGNGRCRVVFVKHDSVGVSVPMNHVTYVGDTIFGSGSQIGLSGWYCVYNGSSDSVTVTNLVQGSNYRVMVCEYNGFSNHELYNSTSMNENPSNFFLVNTNVVNVLTTSIPVNGGSTFGGGVYNIGDTISISETPDSSYNFVNWTENGNIVTNSSLFILVADSNKHYVANYVLKNLTVTTSSYPLNVGLTSGGGTYTYGDTVTVTASSSDTSFVFFSWTKNGVFVSDSSVYTYVITSNDELVANFDSVMYVVQPMSSPSNSGNIGGNGSYTYGSKVVLTAIPYDGWVFYGWTDDCKLKSLNVEYKFTVTGNERLISHFYQLGISHVVLIDHYPLDGGGTIGGCGTYRNDSTIKVYSIPNSGWKFENWKDDNNNVVSTDSIFTLPNSDNVHLTAFFTKITDVENMDSKDILVYPNPVKSTLHIEGAKFENLKIMNSLSGVVYEKNINPTDSKISIGVDNLNSGIYYLIFTNGNGKVASKKIIVIR